MQKGGRALSTLISVLARCARVSRWKLTAGRRANNDLCWKEDGLILVVSLTSVLSILSAQRVLSQETTDSAVWRVEVVKAVSTERARIMRRPPPYFGPGEKAPEGHTWLAVTANFRGTGWLRVKRIRIIDASGSSYVVAGMKLGPQSEAEPFAAVGETTAAGHLGENETVSDLAVPLHLVFSVPAASKELYLSVGDGPRARVQLEARRG